MKPANLTRKQLAYIERVAHNLEGLEAISTGLCPGCDECRSDYWDYRVRELDPLTEEDDEPIAYGFKADPDVRAESEEAAEQKAREAFDADIGNGTVSSEAQFSWSECDICGSRLGGDREPWHYVHGGRVHHADGACVDCMLYLANGDVPDLGPDEQDEEG